MAAKTAAKITVIVSLVTVANSFIFLIPGCQNTNLAGAKAPYHNTYVVNSSRAYLYLGILAIMSLI